ncbi:MAG TPA: HD domain-containing phosphohydrolase, partial [Burkholderiales bacterium]|nr:HD domain-containing phosphohydrolase [Burkholderiales bacterium]
MSDAKPTILAIDDAEGVRRLLEVTLGKSLALKTAPDAHSALAWAQLAPPPDLVLVDTEPAGMSGYELCKALRAMPGFTEVPVIFLAERRDPQGVIQGFQLGALDFLVKPLAAPLLLQRVRGHLEHLARERKAGVQGAELRVGRLVRAMGLYERSLGGNRPQRLAQYARALAQAAGARGSAADLLAKAAPVHDVGKLIVPPELLRNERGLAGAQREQFERHAAAGAEIIGEHEDALLKLARTLALTHHEYWDGSGYPGRLQGNQIPSAGRLMAVVDAFESMTAAQYGGSRMSTEAAVAEIAAGAGTIFDPALVEALRKAAPEFRKLHGAYPEQAADAGDDLVIGAPARSPAAKPAPPAAQADDLVLGAPARDPSDDAGLTMMGPLRLGGGASSADKIREAVQRAAAKAQRPAAPPPQSRPPAEEKPAAVHLDLQLEASTPAATAKPDVPKRAAEAPARGELETLRARVSELELERA